MKSKRFMNKLGAVLLVLTYCVTIPVISSTHSHPEYRIAAGKITQHYNHSSSPAKTHSPFCEICYRITSAQAFPQYVACFQTNLPVVPHVPMVRGDSYHSVQTLFVQLRAPPTVLI